MDSLKPLAPWFSVAFLAAGIPWWLAPYNRFRFSDPAAVIGSLVFVSIGAWVGGRTAFGLKRAALVLGAAFPCAVMVRVVVDGLRDPTSHNLWPFEMVFAGGFGVGVAFCSVLFGRILARMVR